MCRWNLWEIVWQNLKKAIWNCSLVLCVYSISWSPICISLGFLDNGPPLNLSPYFEKNAQIHSWNNLQRIYRGSHNLIESTRILSEKTWTHLAPNFTIYFWSTHEWEKGRFDRMTLESCFSELNLSAPFFDPPPLNLSPFLSNRKAQVPPSEIRVESPGPTLK